MIRSVFVSGVSTAVGKTYLSRGITRALQRRGRAVAALKPIETGVTNEPADAVALARACARPELARASGLYRHPLPLAPYAASLQSGSPPPSVPKLADRVRELAAGTDHLIVEGAGGLLVPLDARHSTADLVAAIALPLLLVARDELGVLASVLSCVESARARNLDIAAIVLTQHRELDLDLDPSPLTNQRILAERLALPVLRFGPCNDDDDALATQATQAGVVDLFIAAL
jgi:dethiobiotin synthetase